jgi:Response regulator of the LytR/AlgR family
VSDTYRNLNSILLYLRPTALLRKPVSLRQYAECLRFILAEYRASGRCFQFRDKSLGKRIPLRDIIYFESSQHNVILHTLRQGAYTFRAKLDDVEHGLHHARFLRCHQSYLVNFENIRGVEQPERRFLLSNGEHIDISRRSYPATLEAYNSFLSERENRF